MSRCEGCLSPTHETDACRGGRRTVIVQVEDLHRLAEAIDAVDEATSRERPNGALALAAVDAAESIITTAQRQIGVIL